mgnify:FL=1
MQVTNAYDLVWANSQNTVFNCMVVFDTSPDPQPFACNQDEVGQINYVTQLWDGAMAGQYGPIAPYVEPIQPVVVVPTAYTNGQTATKLLYETDWTTIPDVANPAVSNPYLMNQADFAAYRSALRAIAVNPTAGELVWPTKPAEVWSS